MQNDNSDWLESVKQQHANEQNPHLKAAYANQISQAEARRYHNAQVKQRRISQASIAAGDPNLLKQ